MTSGQQSSDLPVRARLDDLTELDVEALVFDPEGAGSRMPFLALIRIIRF
jgi:hypothetical protein